MEQSRRSDDVAPAKIDGPVLIVCSTQDPASQNIARNLTAHYGFLSEDGKRTSVHSTAKIHMVTIEKPGIYTDPIDIPSESSSIIFASKHVSSTAKPAMTVHTTGNLTKSADFGGRPEEVSYVDPAIIRLALSGLRERIARAGLQIDVTMEATHHGPTSFHVPVCFVEIGSRPNEWNDPALGRIAADAIMDAAAAIGRKEPTAVAFGGTHYSAKFSRICLDGDFQIGHIVPRHAMESGVSNSVVRDTLRKTIGARATALVDWKGLSAGDRRKLVASLESWGYDFERC